MSPSGISYDQNSLKKSIFVHHKEPTTKVPGEIKDYYQDKTLMKLRDLLWKLNPKLKPSDEELAEANRDVPEPAACREGARLLFVINLHPIELLLLLLSMVDENLVQDVFNGSHPDSLNNSNNPIEQFKNYFQEVVNAYLRKLLLSVNNPSSFFSMPIQGILQPMLAAIQEVNTFEAAKACIRRHVENRLQVQDLQEIFGILFNKLVSNPSLTQAINQAWFSNSTTQLHADIDYTESHALVLSMLNEICGLSAVEVSKPAFSIKL